MSEIEPKYYADGEDAFAMKRFFFNITFFILSFTFKRTENFKYFTFFTPFLSSFLGEDAYAMKRDLVVWAKQQDITPGSNIISFLKLVLL